MRVGQLGLHVEPEGGVGGVDALGVLGHHDVAVAVAQLDAELRALLREGARHLVGVRVRVRVSG